MINAYDERSLLVFLDLLDLSSHFIEDALKKLAIIPSPILRWWKKTYDPLGSSAKQMIEGINIDLQCMFGEKENIETLEASNNTGQIYRGGGSKLSCCFHSKS